MDILLNDKEIADCWPAGKDVGYVPTPFDYALIKAQLKKDIASIEGVLDSKDLHLALCYKLKAMRKEAGIDETI